MNSSQIAFAIKNLTVTQTSAGHWTASAQFGQGGPVLAATTTNSLAVDKWDEDPDYYFEGSFYENRDEAREALVREILQKN